MVSLIDVIWSWDVQRVPKVGAEGPLVRIVDDDSQVRDALVDFLRSEDIEAASYASPEDFWAKDMAGRPGCIVLDIHLGNANGLDFQEDLASRGYARPIVIITGAGDIPMTVRAMKAGAVDFLTKPFSDHDFLHAVRSAIGRDTVASLEHVELEAIETLVGRLTRRERGVMDEIVSGLMNKQIAAKLEISEATVKLHRKNLMQKMEVRTVADLVKKAESLRRSR